MKLFLAALFLCLSPLARALVYRIDGSHSSVAFSVVHLGVVPVKGRFNRFEGRLDYDRKRGVIKSVHLKIDADSINTDNADRDAHLKSADFFHVRNKVYDVVAANRYIEFWASDVPLKTGQGKIQGRLKILKSKRPVTLTLNLATLGSAQTPKRIGAMVSGTIDRRDFGLTWQKPASKLLGKVVGDEVKIDVNLAFVQKTK